MFKVKRSRNATNKTCLLFISKNFGKDQLFEDDQNSLLNLLGEQVLVEVKDKDKKFKMKTKY